MRDRRSLRRLPGENQPLDLIYVTPDGTEFRRRPVTEWQKDGGTWRIPLEFAAGDPDPPWSGEGAL